jgi:hypothetical protein
MGPKNLARIELLRPELLAAARGGSVAAIGLDEVTLCTMRSRTRTKPARSSSS